MCSDFDKVSSSSTMPSSDMFLVKEHKEETGFWISKEEDSLEYCLDFSVTVGEDPDTLQNHDQHKTGEGNSEELQEQECRKQDSSVESEKECSSLGGLREASTVVVNDDDDGFKTPTSSDHKIPTAATDQCPPAPRKSKSHFSMKRKAYSSPAARRNLQFIDIPQDLEPLFSLPILSGIEKKMKKARRDHE